MTGKNKMPNTKKRKILFIGEHLTPSHSQRPLQLAECLMKNNSGYEVELALSELPRIHHSDLTIHQLYSPEADILEKRVRRVLSPLYTKRDIAKMVKADLHLIDKVQPDLIIHDFRNTIAIAAQVKKVPVVSLNDFYWNRNYQDKGIIPDTPLSKILGYKLARILGKPIAPAIDKLHVGQFNAIAKQYGVKAFKNLRDLYNFGQEQWLFDIPAMLPSTDEKTKFIGPLTWESEEKVPAWLGGLEDKSAICITFTSSGNQDLVEKIIQQVKTFNRSIIVLTAGKYHLPPEENVHIASLIPLKKVLQKSQLLITTGGSSMVYHALREAVPVIGIPQNITHWYSMVRFSELEIGTLVPPESVSGQRFKQVLTKSINDNDYAERNEKFRNQLQAYNPKERLDSLCQGILK